MFKIILNLIKVSSCIMCSGFIGFLYIWVPRIAAILITSVFEEYLPHPRTLLGIQHPCKVSCQIYYFFYSGRIHEKYSILFPWTSSQTKITLHDNMRGQDILQTEDCWEKSTCFKYKYPCWCKAPPTQHPVLSPRTGESRTFWETTALWALNPDIFFGNCIASLSQKPCKRKTTRPYFWPSSDVTPHFAGAYRLTKYFSCLHGVLASKGVLRCKQGCAAVLQRNRGRVWSRQPCWAGLCLSWSTAGFPGTSVSIFLEESICLSCCFILFLHQNW